MEKAILATDLSKASDHLMECIPQFKALGIRHITVFHVATLGFNYMEYSGYSMMVHIEARMTSIRNKIREQGIDSDIVLKEGLPSQEIINYAKQQPDTLIIMGSKGSGCAKRNLIGSTTLRVIQHSHRPVLMIRIKYLGKSTAGEVECVLETREILNHGMLLTDFSPNSDLAFNYLKDNLAAHFNQLSLMHVQDTIALRHHTRSTLDRFNRIDTERLNKMAAEIGETIKNPVKNILVEGTIVPEIMREVKLSQVSLIIMGAHGRSYFSDIVLGNIVYPIIQLVESNCLLIPLKQD